MLAVDWLFHATCIYCTCPTTEHAVLEALGVLGLVEASGVPGLVEALDVVGLVEALGVPGLVEALDVVGLV